MCRLVETVCISAQKFVTSRTIECLLLCQPWDVKLGGSASSRGLSCCCWIACYSVGPTAVTLGGAPILQTSSYRATKRSTTTFTSTVKDMAEELSYKGILVSLVEDNIRTKRPTLFNYVLLYYVYLLDRKLFGFICM